MGCETFVAIFFYNGLGLGLWCFMPLFNNISVISWRSVLLVEETGVPTDLSQVTDKLFHIMLYRVHLAWAGFELTTLVVIVTDCIGSYKFNYHTLTTTTAPRLYEADCSTTYILSIPSLLCVLYFSFFIDHLNIFVNDINIVCVL